jgi:hypothetical protein
MSADAGIFFTNKESQGMSLGIRPLVPLAAKGIVPDASFPQVNHTPVVLVLN